MKFVDSQTWQRRDKFLYQNRTSVDSFLLFYFINYLQPKHVLEIGFFEGYTCGLYLEASSSARIDCVDQKFDCTKIFDFLPDRERVNLIQTDSRQLDLKQKYDFINVDGNHAYEFAKSDIDKSLEYINPNGIIMIDDIDQEDVEKAMLEACKENKIIPLIKTTQSLFCMRNGDNAIVVPYLEQIKTLANEFLFLDCVQVDQYQVQHLHGPKIWTRYPDLFDQAIRKYNL